jgi:hypothetical protein
MTEDEIREALREMRDVPVPPDSLARVRLKLEHRIRRRFAWRTAAFLVTVSVTLLVVFLVGPLGHRRVPVASPAVQRQRKMAGVEAPRPDRHPLKEAMPAQIPIVHVHHRAHRKAPAAAPVTIRIQTPDPDVLIVLVGD